METSVDTPEKRDWEALAEKKDGTSYDGSRVIYLVIAGTIISPLPCLQGHWGGGELWLKGRVFAPVGIVFSRSLYSSSCHSAMHFLYY